jgi:4-amino-4-deoxy-L-arabinose transferase-like glycosyltransferase
VAGLLLAGAVWAAWVYRADARPRGVILAGAALGLALGINLTYAVMIPIVGLYLFGADPRRWRIRPIATFAAPVVVALGLLGFYNWARFGGPLATGYANRQDEASPAD